MGPSAPIPPLPHGGGPGLSDEQILNQVEEQKKQAMEKQRLENMDAEEQAEMLKKMFREVGVSLTWKFDDALRNVRQDPRFKYLRMSMATKK